MTVWKIVTQPYQADVTLVVGLWNVLNLIIAGCALGVVAERQNLRPHKRIDVERWCKVLVRGQSVPAVIETVSISAAGIRPMAASLALAPGETAELTIVTTGDEVTLSLPVTVLSVDRDDKGLALGCEFDMGAPAYSQALADLFYADADQWSRFQQSAPPQHRRPRRDGALPRHRDVPDRTGPVLPVRPAAPGPRRRRAEARRRGRERRMRRSLALALIGLCAAAAAPAQQPPAPFAMQPGAATAQPAPPAAAPPQGGGAAGAPRPFDMGGQGPRAPAPGPAATPPAPVAAPGASRERPAREAPAGPAAPAGAGPGRFVVPEEALRLEGEMDARTWSVFLTQEEAADEAALTVAYTNAIFVMPEASRLRASLNGEVVLDAPIESPGGLRTIRVPVRRNLLRAGQNRVRVEVSQRHRTDCSVNATYELWTQLDGAATRLTFARGGARLRSLDDLPAVGADVTGTTTLRAHRAGACDGAGRQPVPARRPGDRDPRAIPAPRGSGRGPARRRPGRRHRDARRRNGERDSAASSRACRRRRPSRAWAGIVADPRQGEVVVATGPSAADVDAAVETLAAPTLRPVGVIRTEVDTLTWSAPDAPLVAGERSIRLSNLDIATRNSPAAASTRRSRSRCRPTSTRTPMARRSCISTRPMRRWSARAAISTST